MSTEPDSPNRIGPPSPDRKEPGRGEPGRDDPNRSDPILGRSAFSGDGAGVPVRASSAEPFELEIDIHSDDAFSAASVEEAIASRPDDDELLSDDAEFAQPSAQVPADPSVTLRGTRGDGTERPRDAMPPPAGPLRGARQDDEGFRYSGPSYTFGRLVVERRIPAVRRAAHPRSRTSLHAGGTARATRDPASFILIAAGILGLLAAIAIAVVTRHVPR